MSSTIDSLWAQHRGLHPDAAETPPTAFHFCDNARDADVCADLVVAGRKRATALSVAELELAGLPLPRVGDLAVVLDGSGRARAVIRTTDVAIRRFGDVDAAFARLEGEGDLTLAWWREAHRAYYERVLAGTGHIVDEDFAVVCETFEVLTVAPPALPVTSFCP